MNTYFDLILSDHRLLICSSNCILITDKIDYQFSLLSINFSPWGGVGMGVGGISIRSLGSLDVCQIA